MQDDGSRSGSRVRRAQRVGWLLVLIVIALVSVDFLSSVYEKYQHPNPDAYTMFWSRRGWLWTHLAGGALTITLGPLQFLTRWPRDWPRLHRWSGRVYLIGMLVAGVGASGLIVTSPAPFEIRSAFAVTAMVWLATALVALVAIRRRRVREHRRWMIRNYLVTLSPITFRLLLHAAIAIGLVPSSMLIAGLLWLSWLAPLLVYESLAWILRLRATARSHSRSIEAIPS